jgi:hypothetical protein
VSTAKRSLSNEAPIEEVSVPSIPKFQSDYSCLRNLLLSEQYRKATERFLDMNMIDGWRDLLHHAMVQKNCKVTKFVIFLTSKHGNMHKEVLRVEVSKLLHGVTVDFANRLQKYMAEGKFDENWEDEDKSMCNLAEAVYRSVKHVTGKELVNLKSHHFDGSYAKDFS